MLNLMETLVNRLTGRAPVDWPVSTVRHRWCSDPLAHPEIRRMLPHEVADLPLRSARISAANAVSADPDRAATDSPPTG